MTARESRAQKEKATRRLSPTSISRGRPEVIVEFLFDKGLLFISVNNIGERPALQVSVKFEEKIWGLSGTKDISSQALFRNIEFLGARREIITFLDSSDSYFGGRQPTKLAARVSYCDREGQHYAETIKHDLEIYRELVFREVSQANAEDPDRLS